MSKALEEINRLSNLRFTLYQLLSRRIAQCPATWGWFEEPIEVRLIREIDKRLEELWDLRRWERRGQALRIVDYWGDVPRRVVMLR
jgi:hypothetical protein